MKKTETLYEVYIHDSGNLDCQRIARFDNLREAEDLIDSLGMILRGSYFAALEINEYELGEG